MAYALTRGVDVIRLSDGAVIPADPRNTDRQAFDAWIDAGGVPEPVHVPAPTVADYQAAIDAHVEAVARARAYNSAASCAGYAASTVPAWAAEALAFITWRDAVYLAAFGLLAQVQAGEVDAPSVAGLVDTLPAMSWPA